MQLSKVFALIKSHIACSRVDPIGKTRPHAQTTVPDIFVSPSATDSALEAALAEEAKFGEQPVAIAEDGVLKERGIESLKAHDELVVQSQHSTGPHEIKPDRKKANLIGSLLTWYRYSLAKRGIELIEQASRYSIDMERRIATLTLDAAGLRAILADASPDPLAAEQELVMAWRHYTKGREEQIAWGEFRIVSTPEEIEAARQFSAATGIFFDPANIKGAARITAQIVVTIERDVAADAMKWQAIAANEEKRLREWGDLWNDKKLRETDTDEDTKERTKFAKSWLIWEKNKAERHYRKCQRGQITSRICTLLEEHRDYWAQRPTEPYDDRAIRYICDFSFFDDGGWPYQLPEAWEQYLDRRTHNRSTPFYTSADEELASDKEDRRKLPIRSSDKRPNAREIIESHIRAIIREDIISDVGKWERHKRKVEDDKKCYQEAHLRRLQEKRVAFITDVRNMFGQKVVDMISSEDVERYSIGVVKRPKDAEELWYSILKKYDFDQNTTSCLYFIRQSEAIKIGITDDLGRRFAQIKTSAALPCKIENVVYTHHGRMLERKLHDALACYNSHLEWFVLPPRIERALFAAKSVDDIENILARINADESEDVADAA